uniref:Uncharacterized protein n=1 Tax=Timema cristinae TaxID=61476 RepID=A0A7R9CJE1_TIMCR|nr:unnamed protein product [Timema cristinae]
MLVRSLLCYGGTVKALEGGEGHERVEIRGVGSPDGSECGKGRNNGVAARMVLSAGKVFFDLLRKIVSLKAAEGKMEVSAPSVGNCCVIQ